MKKNRKTFSFGKNWCDYVNNFLDEEHLTNAGASLLKYLPEAEYAGKTFIDVGCGSGVFSFSALRLGCKRVISFDVDKHCIEATTLTRAKFSGRLRQDVQWEIFEGSILDEGLVAKLQGQGDIVYSWGVLHHTGNMDRAIRNAASLVKPGGFFLIAIYNKTASSDYWLRFKRFYNVAPQFVRKIAVYSVFAYFTAQRSASILLRRIKRQPHEPLFSRERGMSTYYDIIDWLGGYPYEYATFDEIKNFIEALGFQLAKGPTKLPSEEKRFLNRISFNYTGNNEFVFRKKLD